MLRRKSHHSLGEEGAAAAENVPDQVLPDEILVTILELLPRHSVLATAALVNKRWMRVSTSKVRDGAGRGGAGAGRRHNFCEQTIPFWNSFMLWRQLVPLVSLQQTPLLRGS